MDNVDFTFVKTTAPVLIMGGLAFVLPFVFVPRRTRSHLTVGLCVLATAVLLVILGAIITNLFDARGMEGLRGGASLYVVWLYLRESLYFGLLWVPVLGYVWLNLAQRVERLRGEDMAREG